MQNLPTKHVFALILNPCAKYANVVLIGLMMFGISRVLIVVCVFVIIVVWLWLRRGRSASYEATAEMLFTEIRGQVAKIQSMAKTIANHEKKHHKKADYRFQSQMARLCEDVLILLDKLTEKAPDSRMTDGKMLRGLLDYLITDILPQYDEMLTHPRFYDAPDEKRDAGKAAAAILGGFIHDWITELELGDALRYEIAIDMIMALKAHKTGNYTG